MVSVFVVKSANGAIEAIFWVREDAEMYCGGYGDTSLEEYELWELKMRHEAGWFLYERPRLAGVVSDVPVVRSGEWTELGDIKAGESVVVELDVEPLL